MSSSSLSDLVRQVAAEHPNAHPHKIAILVAELVPDELLRDYLASVLERVVADVLRANRNAALNSKQGRSPKVEQRRSWWQRILRERVHVGDSVWKPLGECGVSDFDFCISERGRSCGTVWPCAVVVAHRADSDKCVKCGCAGFRLVDGLCDGCHEADVFDPGG